MHPLVELARKTVEGFIKGGVSARLPESWPTELQEKAGVFVCIKKKGELRGCIGTFVPSCDSVGNETIANAVAAATKDPRFLPVRKEELDELTYSVDVLSCPEKVSDVSELDPAKYGVIVASGNRRGLLLPALEGVDTVEQQLDITRLKAGIAPGEDVEIYRFEVKRYSDGD